MKPIFTLLVSLFVMNSFAQKLNEQIEDPTRQKLVLINNCTRKGIKTFPEMQEIYEREYANYQPDSAILDDLKTGLKDKKITIVLGTWCGDSKLQVPRFLKVIDIAAFDEKNLKFICVDGMKKAAQGLIDHLKITHVPTFIVYDQETELGRIIEKPMEDLEHDLLSIIK